MSPSPYRALGVDPQTPSIAHIVRAAQKIWPHGRSCDHSRDHGLVEGFKIGVCTLHE